MGYDWMVDLEQASDFIGKEALAKIREEGPKRKLVGVEIGGSGLGSYNDGSMIDVFPVHKDGSRIGKVTSACYSPRLEKNIGYAMVPIEHSELGTELEIERPGRDGRRGGREEAVRGSREGDPEAGAERHRQRAGLTRGDRCRAGDRPRRRDRRGHRRQQPRAPPRAARLDRPGAARQGPAAQPGRLDRARVQLHLPGRPLARDDGADARQHAPSTRSWACASSAAASRWPAPRSAWRSCAGAWSRRRRGASTAVSLVTPGRGQGAGARSSTRA